MSELPNIFSTDTNWWWSKREDAYYEIYDGITEILGEHTEPASAAEALQELLDPYRPDDAEDSIYLHIWAVADGERLGIGVIDRYDWYLFDEEYGCWHPRGSTMYRTSDGEPHYEIYARLTLNPPWWSNPEDAAMLKNRVEQYRERVMPYVATFLDVDIEYNDDVTAAELREAFIDYVTAHGPRSATRTVEDLSFDDDHTFLVIREDGLPKGHIAAVNPGESIELADIEEAFDRDRGSFLLVTDHLNFVSPPYDPDSTRTLDWRFDECYEATHLIGLTLDQIMGAEPFPPCPKPETRFLEKHDYG